MYEALVERVRYHIQKADFMGLKEAESTLLLKETADAIEELSVMLDAANDEATALYGALPRWISVQEAQPSSQGPFLVRYGFEPASSETGQYFFAVRDYLFVDPEPHWQDSSWGLEVTHWMPIPAYPEEGESDG